MPLNSRDLWLVLKVQDQTTRALNAFTRNVRSAGSQVSQVQAQQQQQMMQLSNRLNAVSQMATAMGFALTAAGVVGFIALKKSVDVAVEYERQVRATATQVEGFSGNLQELADIGRRVARDIAVPFEQIQPALFDVFSSMDVTVKEAEGLLRSFSKAAVAGQTDIQSVSRATIGILNAFNLPASDVNKILDIQFKLVQKGIGTYEEWNQRIGLVTPSAVRAGQSIEQMAAALAASTRQGVSAARSGTAVARAFDALSNPAAVKALKALGVNAQDAQGRFRPFNQVLREFRNVLMKMPEKDRLKTILDVFKGAGGTIEARRFLQNMLLGKGALDDFDEILKQVSNSSGAMETAYGIMADSTAAKSQLLANQWMLLKEGIGRALIPAFTTVITWVSNLIKSFNDLPDSTKKTVATFLLIATVVTTVIGVIMLIIGVVAGFAAAFVVAGGAIATTLGILAGVAAVVIAGAAAFAVLYKRSFEFRVMLGQLVTYAKLFTQAVRDLAKDAGSTFSNKLGKPLTALWDIINSKVIPAITIMMNIFVSKMLPKLQEAGRILVDIFGAALAWIGSVIQNVVVPALKMAVDWWNKNRDTLQPFISILAQVVKWVIIIGAVLIGVLVAALIGPVILAFAAAAVAIGLLVAAVVYVIKFVQLLWGWLKEFWTWISGVFVGVWDVVVGAFKAAWSGIVDFFTGVWSAIVGVAQAGWQWITDVFNSFMALLGTAWSTFWNSSIGGLLIAIWNFIVAVVKVGIAAVQFAIAWFLVGVQAIWNATWGAIKDFFGAIWGVIVSLQQAAMGVFKAVWNAFWPGIKDFFVGIWNGIKSFFTGVWNAMVGYGVTKVAELKAAVSAGWNAIKALTATIWAALVGLIANPLNQAASKVSGWISTIKGFFSGAASWLYGAGKAIIEGLINGLTSMFDRLTSIANKVASIIKDHLPGSPVKKGPLKVLNNGRAGKTIVRMIANGMTAEQTVVRNAVNQVVGNIANGFDQNTGPYLASGMSDNSGNWGGKTYNIQQTINTQEISPVRQAAALGWEVQTVM
jgi:TP901 family phage tail tape measure protein